MTMEPEILRFRDTNDNEAFVSISSVEGFKIHETMGHGILTTKNGGYYLVHPEHNLNVSAALNWFLVKPPKTRAEQLEGE